MRHAKCQGHKLICSGVEDFLIFFYDLWTWLSVWSCDQDGFTFLFPQPRRLCNRFGYIGPLALEEIFGIVIL